MQPTCYYNYDGSPCTCGNYCDMPTPEEMEEMLATRQEIEDYDEYLRMIDASVDIAETNFVTPTRTSIDIDDDLPF